MTNAFRVHWGLVIGHLTDWSFHRLFGMATIGILALQGDFREHRQTLESVGASAPEVRLPQGLEGLDGLIIPGGESTTIARLMRTSGLLEPLRKLAAEGFPIWGTCAGMILLAKRLDATGMPALEAMDLTVRRNAFGRQVDSFEEDLRIPALGDPPFHAVFIRAPVIEDVGREVEILARLRDGTPVAARQGRLLATAFHPELTGDRRFHQLFIASAAR
jgi:5'-phosphate synthase pdxT subunit